MKENVDEDSFGGSLLRKRSVEKKKANPTINQKLKKIKPEDRKLIQSVWKVSSDSDFQEDLNSTNPKNECTSNYFSLNVFFRKYF